MESRKFWLLFWGIVLIATIVLFVTQSSLLTTALDANNSIPLGTFITWAGIISLPLCIYLGFGGLRNPEGGLYGYLSALLKGVLVLAILWMPICYLLAGNISFSFAERETFQGGQSAMRWFWRYTYGVLIAPLIILFSYLLILIFKKAQKS